ncbi:MAG: tetratricopeptide repeat protein [Ignavibacteriales bacterium]|nr:tetratricopeptide repeat protein [Ignavibacteriales bacterium]
MKRKLLIFFLFIVSITQSLYGKTSTTHWLKDYEEAKREAFLQNKLILIFFRDFSELSKRMENETFTDTSVAPLLKNYVCLEIYLSYYRLGISWGKYEKLSRMFHVEALPTILIVDPVCTVFYRGENFIPADKMKYFLQTLPRNIFGVYIVLDKLDKNPSLISLKIAAGDAYHKIRVAHISNRYYEEVMEAETVKSNQKLSEHVKTFRAINYHLLGDLIKAVRLFEELTDEYPNGKLRPAHLYYLTKLHLQLIEETKARMYFSMLKKKFPNSEYTNLAERLFRKE